MNDNVVFTAYGQMISYLSVIGFAQAEQISVNVCCVAVRIDVDFFMLSSGWLGNNTGSTEALRGFRGSRKKKTEENIISKILLKNIEK